MKERLIHGVLVALVLSLTVWARADAGESNSAALLQQAEDAYDRGVAAMAANPAQARGDFALSAAAYRELAEGRGVRNAHLLANLGNAYLLSGDAGRAVLNYRRAERIDPSDETVRAGLAVARSRVGLTVEPGSDAGVVGWLSAWRSVLTPRSLLFVGAFAWGAGWLALALATVHPRAKRERPWAVAAIVLGAACIGLVLGDEAIRRRSPEAVLVADSVIGRNGPGGAAYAPSFDKPLAAGVELAITEERGDWLRTRLADGRVTWLPRSAVQRI